MFVSLGRSHVCQCLRVCVCVPMLVCVCVGVIAGVLMCVLVRVRAKMGLCRRRVKINQEQVPWHENQKCVSERSLN